MAQRATQAVSTVSAQADIKLTDASGTKTATQPTSDTTTSKAITVTQPAQSRTVTETKTASEPAKITSINKSVTAVKVVPTSTAASTEPGGGVPWWGWVLIVLGVVVIGIAIFALGRRHGGGNTPPSPKGPAEGS